MNEVDPFIFHCMFLYEIQNRIFHVFFLHDGAYIHGI